MSVPQRQKTNNYRGRNKTWKDLGGHAMGMIVAEMQHKDRQDVFHTFMNLDGEIDCVDYAHFVTDNRRQRNCGRRGRVAMALIHPANNPLNNHKDHYNDCSSCRYMMSRNKTRYERNYSASQARTDMINLRKQYNSIASRAEIMADYGA